MSVREYIMAFSRFSVESCLFYRRGSCFSVYSWNNSTSEKITCLVRIYFESKISVPTRRRKKPRKIWYLCMILFHNYNRWPKGGKVNSIVRFQAQVVRSIPPAAYFYQLSFTISNVLIRPQPAALVYFSFRSFYQHVNRTDFRLGFFPLTPDRTSF